MKERHPEGCGGSVQFSKECAKGFHRVAIVFRVTIRLFTVIPGKAGAASFGIKRVERKTDGRDLQLSSRESMLGHGC